MRRKCLIPTRLKIDGRRKLRQKGSCTKSFKKQVYRARYMLTFVKV